MDYKKIERDDYNIHIINNKKFHNIAFAIYFTQNVDEEKFTYHNLLVNILTTACKKYDTRSKIVKKTQDIYSISPYASTVRAGNVLSTKFAISILNSKYLDKNIIKENILLLKEIILNPLIENNKFNQKYFELSLNDEISKTERLVEYSEHYTNYKAIKISSNKHENYQITRYCDIDKLKKMTNEKLYEIYQKMLTDSKIDFYISGNIDNQLELIDFIHQEFKFNNHYQLNKAFYEHLTDDNEIKYCKEKKDSEQSKVSMVIKPYNLTDFERRYVSTIFNNVLGGGANSLLNMNIREENSIAYSMYSYYNKPDNIFCVNGGFNKDNYDKIVKMVKKCIEKIQHGEFTTKLFNAAKKLYINEVMDYDESNMTLVSFYYSQDIFQSPSITERIKEVKKITKEDVIKFSKKIKISSIYYLEGEK